MKYALSVSALLLGVSLYSQTITLNVLRKADNAYDEFSYSQAVEYYKLALKNEENSYITSQIALSYRNLNNQDSAEVWLKKAIDKGEDNPEFSFFLAEALLSNQKIEEAKYWYGLYNTEAVEDGRSGKKLSAIENYDLFFRKEDQIDVFPIKDNSPGLDFSPAFYKDGLVFVSSRPKSSWINQEFNWDETSFLDYQYIPKGDSVAIHLADGLNTKYHEGPLVEYHNGNAVAYTRNNFDGKKLIKDKKGITNLKLYFAEWDSISNQWINELPFEHNSDNYSVSSPAISENGEVLIFSSDRPGGRGASDLYISRKTDEGWSNPQNLGAEVNSKGRDGFPFLLNDILYFSSDGREGLGGLDIYQVKFDGVKVIGQSENIGYPINSNKDDFGLIKRGDAGFFSSNRNQENRDDIYQFLIKSPEMILVAGDVYDIDTNLPLSKSDVFLEGEAGDITYTRSASEGKYQAYVPVNSSWKISAGKNGFELVSPIEISVNERDTSANRIYLKREENWSDTTSIPSLTEVVDNRIKPYDETGLFVDQLEVGDTARFSIVYYDLNESTQRPESKAILDKIANFMIEHVDVKAVLASHTDVRSTNSYNQKLSERRSNSTEDYLIYMGANPVKIQKINYGEEKPLNNCDQNAKCSDEEHEVNRRTEIFIIKIEEQLY